MVFNPRDHNWIPNATDNPWANGPGKDPEHEYHVIHTLGWSLQLTDITLTLIWPQNTCTMAKFSLSAIYNEVTLFQIRLLKPQ